MKFTSRFLMKAAFASITNGEKMMLKYCQAIEKGGVPDHETLVFFGNAFEQILLNNAQPQKALDLEKKRGRKRPITAKEAEPRASIARAVLLLMRENGFTYEKAVERISLKHDISYKTVQRYYGEYKEHAANAFEMIEALKSTERLIERGRSAYADHGKLAHIFTRDKEGKIVFRDDVGNLPCGIILEEITKGLLPKK